MSTLKSIDINLGPSDEGLEKKSPQTLRRSTLPLSTESSRLKKSDDNSRMVGILINNDTSINIQMPIEKSQLSTEQATSYLAWQRSNISFDPLDHTGKRSESLFKSSLKEKQGTEIQSKSMKKELYLSQYKAGLPEITSFMELIGV